MTLVNTQRLLSRDVENEKTQPGTRANIAKVLVQVIQLKREIRMVPKPKPVDVSKPRLKPTSATPLG